MFSWFRKKPKVPPPPLPGLSDDNPGKLTHIYSTEPDNPQAQRLELDAADVLARVLQDAGVRFARRDTWFLTVDGLAIQPGIVAVECPPRGTWHVSSTIETRFSTNGRSHALWEYQHGLGETLPAAAAHGFQSWAETDLPALRDAVRDKPAVCSSIAIPYPATETRAAQTRRVILGPPYRTVTKLAPPTLTEDHPFCPCCLFTRLRELFGRRLEDERTYGIRFYAYRADDGGTKADCRINGLDWPEGIAALKDYASTWFDQGHEVRKQYVVIHTHSGA